MRAGGRPLRICFFNRAYYPEASATGQLLTDLAEDLAAAGHEVWVIAGPPAAGAAGAASRAGALSAGRGLFRREDRRGVRVVRARGTALPRARFAARALHYMTYFWAAWLAALGLPRPDVVVALTDPPIIGLAARALARRSGARFVFLCQDVFPEVARLLGDFRSPRVDRALDRVTRRLIADADRVVAVGETMRQRLVTGKGADPRRVAVIHNWADCAAIAPGPRDNAWAAEHGLSGRFVVMHSGNVGLSQGLDVLVDAAERLAGHADIAVAIVGDGVARPGLEARVRARGLESVRFLPAQPRERLAEVFAAADVFVIGLLPGLGGYIVPSKLYGILAAGRPYVAHVDDDSEVAEITRRHHTGLLAPPGDAGELARLILKLHGDRALGRELGDNARRAAPGFDRRVAARAWEALCREVTAAPPRVPPRRRLKRGFDVALAGLGLAAALPVGALIAAAVKLGDGGPVFYGQVRVGRGGRRFRSWKFRSMVVDADRRFGAVQAREDDPRITRVGRVLRATAMDELPQLWNILVGDMSFVGPRALLPAEIEVRGDGTPVPLEAVVGYEARQRVTPGLTGLAQVYAARDIPRRQKFRLDRLYADRQSLGLDLRLIALSLWITLRGRWERRGAKV